MSETSNEWKSQDGGCRFIKQVNGNWIEYHNGRKFADFTFIKYGKSDEVIIDKHYDGNYWKLSSTSLMKGSSKCSHQNGRNCNCFFAVETGGTWVVSEAEKKRQEAMERQQALQRQQQEELYRQIQEQQEREKQMAEARKRQQLEMAEAQQRQQLEQAKKKQMAEYYEGQQEDKRFSQQEAERKHEEARLEYIERYRMDELEKTKRELEQFKHQEFERQEQEEMARQKNEVKLDKLSQRLDKVLSIQKASNKWLEKTALNLNAEGLMCLEKGEPKEAAKKFGQAIRDYKEAAAKLKQALSFSVTGSILKSFIQLIESFLNTKAYEHAQTAINDAKENFPEHEEFLSGFEKAIQEKSYIVDYSAKYLEKLNERNSLAEKKVIQNLDA